MRDTQRLLWGAVLSCAVSVSHAATPGVDPALQQLMSSPAALQQARNEGGQVASFCANCHGDKGTSAYDYIPNLAGQNPAYLLSQIGKFADGQRKDDFMTGMIKAIKKQDRINVALFYASERVQLAPTGTPYQVAHGKKLYHSICISCHGADGHGNERIARLAGQHATYISQSLDKYRAGAGDRKDPVMGSVARRLSNDDIAAVAAYISTMP